MHVNYKKIFSFLKLIFEKLLIPCWMILAGIPVAFAIIELFLFGIKLDSGFLKPIMTPRAECKYYNDPIIEGKNRLYELDILFSKPLYLTILPFSMSIPVKIELYTKEGASFYKADFIKTVYSPLDLEKRYNSNPEVSKSLHFKHIFISNEKLVLNAKISSSLPVLGDKCLFDLIVHY